MNALSEWLKVEVKRDGTLYRQRYERGEPVTKLAGVDTVGKRNTGTRVCFLPEGSYFDSSSLAMGRLRHLLRAKAVLCPGLRMSLAVETKPRKRELDIEDGLRQYLEASVGMQTRVPAVTIMHQAGGNGEAVEYALKWVAEGSAPITESYVNLIPTEAGGTHVNGLRSGLIDALKEFGIPRPAASRGKNHWRRHLGSVQLCAQRQAPGPAVRGSNQGAAVLSAVCSICVRCGRMPLACG